MADGSVQGEFASDGVYEGYVGRLHGGMIAALLDGAMTQCLFAHGCQALTAELTVRYRHPVATTERLTVRAWLADSRTPLHILRAELRQGDQVKATALGKFMEGELDPAATSGDPIPFPSPALRLPAEAPACAEASAGRSAQAGAHPRLSDGRGPG